MPAPHSHHPTRQALMDAARQLLDGGRAFSSLSLREVTRVAGIVPTGFYRHFKDMDALGLALVAEVGETFRITLRQVRRNEFELGGIIDASVQIFLDAVEQNRGQFLFLAREQFGGSLPVRQALATFREDIAADLVSDLSLMPKLQHLDDPARGMLADLVVKTVFATLPELIDAQSAAQPSHRRPQTKMTEQLRFILIGAKRWRGLGLNEAAED
ncbi:transcriptional regulator, TetR family [Pseudomonas flavescens]|uniref:Transcriptional regulator, TetR family n=1 Tax=Phytopseudomonas flavescens TaxID=29435 RepID=A0A1G8H923_9GAMM|nr:TetR family transcriptional regulator [Pseudomonas flavescens]SDI03127.1 transcriptional regulator, TetR family [Pseudomonas flavescens]